MRIKITGYIDTATLSAPQLDESHPTGLSSEGYRDLMRGSVAVCDLDELRVEAEQVTCDRATTSAAG